MLVARGCTCWLLGGVVYTMVIMYNWELKKAKMFLLLILR